MVCSQMIEYLPLSQTSAALRSIANHEAFSYTTIGILLLYLACFSDCCVLVSV